MKKSIKTLISILSFCATAQLALEAHEIIKKGNNMTTSFDVCDIGHIYNNEYEYSLPKRVLEVFLSGNAFDNHEAYTEDESFRLHEDINLLFRTILSDNPEKGNLAVITAGAPGAGKTMIMRQDLNKKALLGRHFAYICPDDVCLQNQFRTFRTDIENGDRSKEAHQAAYNKWRPGSNAATHLILGNLIREGYSFYLGSTSSGPGTGRFFAFLKKQGYHIRLIHVTAPDDVRWGSIMERDQTFVQTTEQDVREKGLLLPQRIMDTFLAYADEIEFYYRDGVEKDAQLAAKWDRSQDASEKLGTLQVFSRPQYEQIKAIHNAAIQVLERPDLQWELTVEKNSSLVSTY